MDQKQKGEIVMGTQTSRQRGRRVLVVDDDPEVIQILGVNLAHANFDVISARNGAEALAKASKDRPDLILLDIILPDLDGLNVCRQLKESPQTSHIPVIAISAKVETSFLNIRPKYSLQKMVSCPKRTKLRSTTLFCLSRNLSSISIF